MERGKKGKTGGKTEGGWKGKREQMQERKSEMKERKAGDGEGTGLDLTHFNFRTLAAMFV